MFIQPNSTHTIPNISRGFIFGRGYMQKDIWLNLLEACILGSLYLGAHIGDFTV